MNELTYKYFAYLHELTNFVNENNIKVVSVFPDSYELHNGKLDARNFTLVYEEKRGE